MDAVGVIKCCSAALTFSVQWEWGWSAASYREASAIPSGVASLTPSALSVLVILVPHCCLCHFRGILLGLCLLLWGGLCIHKGEVGGIVRGIAGVSGEREGDGGRI